MCTYDCTLYFYMSVCACVLCECVLCSCVCVSVSCIAVCEYVLCSCVFLCLCTVWGLLGLNIRQTRPPRAGWIPRGSGSRAQCSVCLIQPDSIARENTTGAAAEQTGSSRTELLKNTNKRKPTTRLSLACRAREIT